MSIGVYKEVQFDACHRLMHYKGKCNRLHGHRWKVEVWVEGECDIETRILMDYNLIKEVIETFDHQTILNEEDNMVSALEPFQPVIVTPGDPSSELLAVLFRKMLEEAIISQKIQARVLKIRVWESPTCYAELI